MKYRSVIVYALLISMLFSGCASLLTGNVKQTPIDFSKVDDGSGITALGLKDDERIRVKINYGDAADFDANKYSALYYDAFCVAPDLSNNLENVSYFELLDTYEDDISGITFVYAYRTRKYANGATRNEAEKYMKVQTDADVVMYPAVKEEVKLPVSDDSYIVLATYSFALGKDSYHEIARIKSNDERFCLAKVSNTNNNGYKSKYYSVLDETKLYIFDADNVKAFASQQKSCFLLSRVSGVGVASYSNSIQETDFKNEKWPDLAASQCAYSTDLTKVTKAGFVKFVDFAEEFRRLTDSDVYKSVVTGNMGKDWNMDVYDYSIYSDNSVTKLFFDITVTSAKYESSADDENKIEQYNEDGSLKELDKESQDYADKSDDELRAENQKNNPNNWSYDFVGTITIENIDSVDVRVVYYPATTNTIDYYVAFDSIDGLNEDEDPLNAEYRDNFGKYRLLYKKDGTPPLDLLARNNSSGLLYYGNKKYTDRTFSIKNNQKVDNIYYWNGDSEKCFIGELADFSDQYSTRMLDSSTYAYANTEYTLARHEYTYNPDKYQACIYDANEDIAIMYESYVVGDLGLTTSYEDAYKNTATPDKPGKARRTIINDDDEEVTYGFLAKYNYIAGLKGRLDNAVLHTLILCVPSSSYKGTYVYDNKAVFYNQDLATRVFDLKTFPLAYLYSGIYIDMLADDEYLLNKTDPRAGKLQSLEPVIIGDKMYVYYIYENEVEIASILEEDENNGKQSYPSIKEARDANPGSKYYLVDISKFQINKDIEIKTSLSLNVAYDKESELTKSLDKIVNDDTTSNIGAGGFTNSAGAMVTFHYKTDDNGNNIVTADNSDSITAEYNVEGIVYRDKNGREIGKLTYEQALEIAQGSANVSKYIASDKLITYWYDSDKLFSNNNYSLQGSLLNEGLAYRYIIELKQGNAGTIGYSIYDTNSGTYKLITSNSFEKIEDVNAQKVASIDVATWNSICNYIKGRITEKKESKFTESKGNYTFADNYKARNLVYFKGTFETSSDASGPREQEYFVSVTPTYGLGLYNINTGRTFSPNFQRHEVVYKVVHMFEKTGETVKQLDDATALSDDIKPLGNMACYGIYKNNGYTRDWLDYPYLFMGYDRDDMTYTNSEMLLAKMVPFGVAFYDSSKDERVDPSVSANTAGEHRYGYYRDFVPAAGEDVVYYLRDARYEPNGNMIVDGGLFAADSDKTFDPGQGEVPSKEDGTNPSVNPGTETKPDQGNNQPAKPGEDTKPSGDKKPSADPNPSEKPGPTVNPKPTDNNSKPSDGRGYGYDGYEGAGNNGYDGIVKDDKKSDDNMKSLYDDRNSDNSGSPGDNVSDNNVSDNNVSDNKVTPSSNNTVPDGVSDNSISDSSVSNGAVSNNGDSMQDGLPWWLLLLIIIILLIIAYIIYRKKNELPIIPESLKLFIPVLPAKKEEEDDSEEPDGDEDLDEPDGDELGDLDEEGLDESDGDEDLDEPDDDEDLDEPDDDELSDLDEEDLDESDGDEDLDDDEDLEFDEDLEDP